MTTPAESAASRLQQTTGSRSRRALLAGGLGGLAAWAVSAIGRANPVRGADGDVIHVGDQLTATSRTQLTNTTNTIPVFSAQSTSGQAIYGISGTYVGVTGSSTSSTGVTGLSTSGDGVYGQTTAGTGVRGYSQQSIGVSGSSDASDKPAIRGWQSANGTAILGFSNDGAADPPPARAKTGVYGQATQDSNSRGVWGRSNAGQGVRGQATSGAGLFGTATSGYAIRGAGRLRLDKISGVASVAAGSTVVTVTPGVDVNASSFLLLTPKANLGGRDLWFTTDPANDRFTIHLSSARSSATRIAWLLIG